MSSVDPSTDSLSPETEQALEQVIEPFERAWRAGQRPSIDAHIPTQPTEQLSALRQLVNIDLEYRLKSGEPARVEDYLVRYPALAERHAIALELIAREYLLRRRSDPDLSPEEYAQRFPQYLTGLVMKVEKYLSWSDVAASRAELFDLIAQQFLCGQPLELSTKEYLQRFDKRLPEILERYLPDSHRPRAKSEPVDPSGGEWIGIEPFGGGPVGAPDKAVAPVSTWSGGQDGSQPGADAPTQPPTAASETARSWPPIPGYEILEVIGRGGMGKVYKARHVKLNRLVAIKMVLSGKYAEPEEMARFRREAETIARLQHPHVVQVFDMGECDEQPFVVLEYVEGGSLAQKLAGKPLPAAEAARLVEILAMAVHAAHQRGIIHRDLKPANVLLTADGMPKITDFGLAKHIEATTQHTPTGAILGTAGYLAPEQADSRGRSIGPAADIYALGAILYELLTGQPPFKGPTPLETVLQALSRPPLLPSLVVSGIPRDLEKICLKCLEKEPNDRYATAEQLANDLCNFQDQKPITFSPPTKRSRATMLRRTGILAGLLVLVPATLFLFGWFLAFHGAPESSPDKIEKIILSSGGEQLKSPAKAEGTSLETPPRVPARIVPIDRKRRPDIVAIEHHSDQNAGVAVRADEATRRQLAFSDGGIVIILDCSGSMLKPEPQGITRFDLVKGALKRIIDVIPQGAQVSIWVFGQEIPGVYDGTYQDAEKSVQPLLGAGAAPIKNWAEHDAGKIKQLLDTLRPIGSTPLVYAMRKARDDLREIQGRKVMIVLTDGADTHFEPGDYFLPDKVHSPGDQIYRKQGENIAAFLQRAFDKSGIEIHMVGFGRTPNEQEILRKQFKAPLRGLHTPGTLFQIEETSKLIDRLLIDRLTEILRPRLNYTVLTRDWPITRPGGNEIEDITRYPFFQRLEAGEHEVRTAEPTGILPCRIQVSKGDYLVLRLTPYTFVADVYGNQSAIGYPRDPRSSYRNDKIPGWLTSVVSNYHTLDADSRKEIRMMVAIESTTDPGPGGTLRQERPRFVWMEAKPRDGSAVPLYFRNVDRPYPAPIWQLNGTDWPDIGGRHATPELDVWWMRDEPHTIGSFKWSQLAGNRSNPLPVSIEGGSIVEIKGVQMELHFFAGVNHPCIAVRLSYPPGHPVLVRLKDRERWPSSEQQLYLKDNKYTGYFLVPADVSDVAFEIISLSEVKRSPLHAVFTNLGPPSETFGHPDPARFK